LLRLSPRASFKSTGKLRMEFSWISHEVSGPNQGRAINPNSRRS